MDHKAPDAFRTISEVADELDVPQHVLRFWETRFHEIRPMKRGGGRRYYRPDDVDLLRGIRHLLYGEGYTIRGVQRILHEEGQKFVQAVWQTGAPQPPHRAGEIEDDEMLAEAEDDAPPRQGLRGRLTSLIGQDLNERELSEQRRDPPLRAAPVPRIDPADRIAPSPEIARAPQPVVHSAPASLPQAPPAQLSIGGAVAREDLRKLHAVLHELGECRKLLAAAAAAT